ncbi:hypothetical protein ACFQYP_21415 [Nonomuraea antimicrobica]
MGALVDFLAADPRRARILAHEFPASPLLQERRRGITGELAGIFIAQVHEVFDEPPLGDEDLELTALTVVGGLWELLAAWFRGDVETGREHLVDFVVALVLTSADLTPALDHRLR